MKRISVFTLVALLFFMTSTSRAIFASQAGPDTADILGTVIKRTSLENLSIDALEATAFVRAIGVEVLLVGPENRRTFIDSNGKFAFIGLKPGKYEIKFISPIYLEMSLTDIYVEAGDVFDTSSIFPMGVPLGSAFYLFTGINRDDKAYCAEQSAKYIYGTFREYNAISSVNELMIGENFTKDAFVKYLKSLGAILIESDQLFFYYSGFVFINEENDTAYFDCADAVYIDGEPVYETLISEYELVSWFNEYFASTPQIIMAFDSPHSKAFGKRLVENLMFPCCIITGADGENWYELLDFNVGALTISLDSGVVSVSNDSGLPYTDINQDGKVTLSEWNSFTRVFLQYLMDIMKLDQELLVYANDRSITENTIFVLKR